MTIQTFYTRARSYEFARDFQFRIVDLPPFSSDDLVYVQTATLPAKTVQNQVVNYMGLDFNIPGSVKFDGSNAWAVTLWCDEGLNLRNKMEAFIQAVFDINSSTGLYGVPEQVAQMDLLGKQQETIRSYQFTGIYPVTVGELAYDIQGTGAVLSLTCTFAYQYWTEI